MPAGTRALVERGHRRDAARSALEKRVHRELRDVVPEPVLLDESHARGHLQQVAQRRAPVLGSGEPGHVRRGGIVDRADATLRDGDPDQHRRDRLGHRPRREPVAVGPRVLVALDEDRLVAGDQQPGRRVPRQVVVEAEGLPLVLVAQRRLGRGPRERRRVRGPADHVRREDLVLVALRADQIGDAEEGHPAAEWIALAGSLLVGIRSTRVEARPEIGGLRRRRRRRRCGARDEDDRERGGDDLTQKIHSRPPRSRAARPRGTRSPRARRGEWRRARAPTAGRSPRHRRS